MEVLDDITVQKQGKLTAPKQEDLCRRWRARQGTHEKLIAKLVYFGIKSHIHLYGHIDQSETKDYCWWCILPSQ